jgi:hypothetical protein
MWVIWNASHVHRPTTTRHSSRQAQTQRGAQDIHAQAKTYGAIQFPTIGNKTEKRAPGVCVTFSSSQNLLLKVAVED